MTETIEGVIPTKAIKRILSEAIYLAEGEATEALQILMVSVAHLLGGLNADTAQIEMDGFLMKITTERVGDEPQSESDISELPCINWNEMSRRGLVFRINHEILHPLGLAVSYNPSTGTSECAYVSPDGGFEYSDELKEEARANGWIK
ncbi:DUF7415 domain-containing protein [Lelliottia nimipressuralis]|uniref:DUF7415 domain-containing protein n=1 Tax=Lelliottia nimipressuralis TaxID=69220 RepID=UPI00289763F2|nr:hypothetical protein [Lelliottia nimipressuralis]